MAKKRYGQHFLYDPAIVRRIVALADLRPGDTVVEIGPGRGILTRELALACARVIAIEIDRDLIEPLRATLPSNVNVIHGDALEAPFDSLTPGRFHVVGNLPYNISTPLLQRFIENRARIERVTVMVQKEVAERIAAKPGVAAYGPLSVLVQYYAAVTIGFTVSPGSFRPPPKVHSAVIRLDWKPNVPDAREFTDFVREAFSERRKKLVNNLRRLAPAKWTTEEIRRRLADIGVSPDARPERLSIEEFRRVYNRICRD